MSSIIKVDTVKDIASTDIIKKSGTSITVGTASDTTTVAGNAVRSNAIQAADGQNIISQVGTTITLGATGDTVEIATGATLVGGGIAWQSSIVTAATLTAETGKGYWINTTSNACTITLPASASVGDRLIFTDYLRTWGTNAVTINQNSLNFQGNSTPNPVYDTAGESIDIVYSGATQGWIPNSDGEVALETPQTYSVDFLVVAGGGGGSVNNAGGGGGGGMRTSTQTVDTGVTITCTVGGGGGGSPNSSTQGTNGSNSLISGTGLTTITSAGGGGGGNNSADGLNGGSGGGAGYNTRTGGSGNTPSTSPSQGASGGNGVYGAPAYAGGGGGGGGASGITGANSTSSTAGNGGNGTQSSITGSATYYAGGGGGSGDVAGIEGTGGLGGGGAGSHNSPTRADTYCDGTDGLGGGGGAHYVPPSRAGNGGSGVVILSMPDANYSGTTTGSPTVATGVSGKTVLTFTGDGSYTA